MKKLLAVLLCLGIFGCATPPEPSFTIMPYSDVKYTPTDPYKVKIFKIMPPEIQANYITIAELTANAETFANLKNLFAFQQAVAQAGGNVVVVTINKELVGFRGRQHIYGDNIYGHQRAVYNTTIDGIVLRGKDLVTK